jgi:uncharacterized Tic20 family protein
MEQPSHFYQGPGQGAPYIPTSDDKTWGMFAHLSCVIGGWILALVVYVTQKDKSPWVRKHAVDALNWHLTKLIISFICIPLIFVIIGYLLILALFVVSLVYGINGAMKANAGQEHSYPFSFKFVS